jgi:hypothetical protein
MTMMMARMKKLMIGRKWKKKIIGILILPNLTFLNQKGKKAVTPGKKGAAADEDDEFKVDDEFKDMFNDSDDFGDEEDDY